MTYIIIFFVGFVFGFIFCTVGMRKAMISDPARFIESLTQDLNVKLKGNGKPSMQFYIEEDVGKFYAYSSERNKFEGMSSSSDELIQQLCLKYPDHDIVVMYVK